MDIDFKVTSIRIFMAVNTVLFLVLSYHVVRSDLTTQKIPNILILKFLKIGAALLAFFLIYGLAFRDVFAVNYVRTIAINTLVALVFGYAFWYFDLWSAGDGKYFPLAAMFVPLHCYTFQFVPYFPSLIILINAYVIGFLILFAYTCYLLGSRFTAMTRESGFRFRDFASHQLKHVAKKSGSLSFYVNLAGSIIYFLTILLIIRSAYDAMNATIWFSSANLSVISMVVLYFAGQWFFKMIRKNKVVHVLALACFVGVITLQYFVLHQNIAARLIEMIATSLFMIAFIPLAKRLIEEYQRVTETITVGELRQGTVISEQTAAVLKQGQDIDIPALVELDNHHVQLINDNFPNSMKIQKESHITFGPFIFIGSVFTLLFSRSIMHYIL